MTEAEIQALTLEALGDVPDFYDVNIEREWLKSQLLLARKTEQEEMCAFKFHKFMGKHEQMKQNAANLKDIRAAIEYFKSELNDQHESSNQD